MDFKLTTNRLMVREIKNTDNKWGLPNFQIESEGGQQVIKGKVTAVGKLDNPAIDVKVDDRIIYMSYSGIKMKIADEELTILSSWDVLAVIE